jgi:hypothetical protein
MTSSIPIRISGPLALSAAASGANSTNPALADMRGERLKAQAIRLLTHCHLEKRQDIDLRQASQGVLPQMILRCPASNDSLIFQTPHDCARSPFNGLCVRYDAATDELVFLVNMEPHAAGSAQVLAWEDYVACAANHFDDSVELAKKGSLSQLKNFLAAHLPGHTAAQASPPAKRGLATHRFALPPPPGTPFAAEVAPGQNVLGLGSGAELPHRVPLADSAGKAMEALRGHMPPNTFLDMGKAHKGALPGVVLHWDQLGTGFLMKKVSPDRGEGPQCLHVYGAADGTVQVLYNGAPVSSDTHLSNRLAMAMLEVSRCTYKIQPQPVAAMLNAVS